MSRRVASINRRGPSGRVCDLRADARLDLGIAAGRAEQPTHPEDRIAELDDAGTRVVLHRAYIAPRDRALLVGRGEHRRPDRSGASAEECDHEDSAVHLPHLRAARHLEPPRAHGERRVDVVLEHQERDQLEQDRKDDEDRRTDLPRENQHLVVHHERHGEDRQVHQHHARAQRDERVAEEEAAGHQRDGCFPPDRRPADLVASCGDGLLRHRIRRSFSGRIVGCRG